VRNGLEVLGKYLGEATKFYWFMEFGMQDDKGYNVGLLGYNKRIFIY
jgi:hypothetical protein